MHSCLFADDTTLSIIGDNLSQTIVKLSRQLIPFLDWFKLSKLKINWSKIKLMFITKQRAVGPYFFVSDIDLVDEFKLLDISIDPVLFFFFLIPRFFFGGFLE